MRQEDPVEPSSRPSGRARRARSTLALTAGVLVAALSGLGVQGAADAADHGPAPASAGTASSAPSAATGRYVVRLAAGEDAASTGLRAAVEAVGGRLLGEQHALHTAVVLLPPPMAGALSGLPGVRAVVADQRMRTASLGFSPSSQSGSMTNVTRLTGAQSLWKSGITGAGVDVALVDSGVAPVRALSDAAKVVVGPDLSFESQDPDLRYLDTYGHGTHMGGIIAGREIAKGSGTQYAADTTNFYGMAPDSRLVEVKVADHDGAVDVSQVIAAVDWVVQNKAANGLNIRVLNLSFGTMSPQSAQIDPLSWAAEVAWRNGIVVVASAGNEGATTPGIANPAYNPFVLAVGAADTKGTDGTSDDTIPDFSARQGGNWGSRGIDVVAPGVGIVAPGVPGSGLITTYPGAVVGNGFLRGSGTSQAAAVVSGGVALLLQQRPRLTPDDVKQALKATARVLPGQPTTGQGSGEVNLTGASAFTPVNSAQTWQAGLGDGSLESARNGFNLTMDGVPLNGELDIFGGQWHGSAMASAAANRSAWSADGFFNGTQWNAGSFASDTVTVAGKTWSGKTWSGKTWSGKTWSGKTWSGKTWSGAVWSGAGWSSAAWPSTATNGTWAGKRWSASSWG
jgi:serine protease AprX